MAKYNDWSFQQLGGDPPKFLELVGYNAPFGRPRQRPVAREILKSRVQTSNYPGRSGRPTRHSFGVNWEPMELVGRWQTRSQVGTIETANSIANDWMEFMRDELPFRMSWGNIVSYIGYMEELEIARESEDHIAWRMKILIDKNDSQKEQQSVSIVQPSVVNLIDDLFGAYVRMGLSPFKPDLPSLPNLSFDFLDKLDFYARALNGPAATINKLAGQFSDVEKASFATLGHMRSAVKAFEIAFVDFRNLVMDTKIDAANFARHMESDVEWIQFQLNLGLYGFDLLATCAAIDRKCELEQRQQFTKVITAKSPDFDRGESWESLSIRATGTAANASKIRAANGGGGHAIPGEVYLVP